ncbi:transcription initiation factor TFIID subunit 1-like isoform X2 [Camellia sinensis]|uniref:transcription initiation factor TFIID subunit 1-like isoform X2 n=1 Tax=Camellia sinensis TaxID=4442 RepID=UPI0010355568|nr:transcription initiation factor TFIID subunit 1-like isoform X2 [Camellia sinensis]
MGARQCTYYQKSTPGDQTGNLLRNGNTVWGLYWIMRRNFRIPLEEELRRMVMPENVCAYESMLAGLCKLKQLGITRLTNSNGLSSAMNQLPDEAIALAAASHIERELQITPWSLSSNFVACTSQVNYFTLIPCILSTSAADVVIVQILVWASELCGFVVVGVYYCITASCSSCLGA